jgi:hypothetical protein
LFALGPSRVRWDVWNELQSYVVDQPGALRAGPSAALAHRRIFQKAILSVFRRQRPRCRAMNRPYKHGTILGLRRAREIFRLFAVE